MLRGTIKDEGQEEVRQLNGVKGMRSGEMNTRSSRAVRHAEVLTSHQV